MIYFFCVQVAQLDRASASGAEGREFESHLEHHKLKLYLKKFNLK